MGCSLSALKNKVRVYTNRDLVRVIAFIPQGHKHIRTLLEFSDGLTIVLQEASTAGIVRAYLNVLLHPERVVEELVLKKIDEDSRKKGYAEWQLVESGRGRDDILAYVEEKLSSSSVGR